MAGARTSNSPRSATSIRLLSTRDASVHITIGCSVRCGLRTHLSCRFQSAVTGCGLYVSESFGRGVIVDLSFIATETFARHVPAIVFFQTEKPFHFPHSPLPRLPTPFLSHFRALQLSYIIIISSFI